MTFAQDFVRGELPTTGGMRPGPIGFAPVSAPAIFHGSRPVAIRIASVQVDADVQEGAVVDGLLQDPTGPWVVAWYPETSRVGTAGNAVMAGHLDYWGTGPAVFARIGELAEGDEIEVTGNNGRVYRYAVAGNDLYDAATAPIAEIVGPTEAAALTLITCGGAFDQTARAYEQRRVVRAELT